MKKMNMTIVSAIVILMSCITFAKPVIEIQDKAQTFLKNRNLQIQKNRLQNNSGIIGKSFVVAVDENSNKTFMKIKEMMAKSFDVVESKKNLKIRNKNIKMDISNLNLERSVCAKRMLNQILPRNFVSQFRLVSVDVEKSFSRSLGVRVEGYTFNYKRLFNNRIVRNANNYLNISIDGLGRLKEAEIAVEDLTTTSVTVDVDENFSENKTTIDSLVGADFEFVDFVDESGYRKRESVSKIEVNGAAEAYCEILVEKKKILLPCLSYTSKIDVSSGEKIDYIIDVPHSRKSWSQYRHEQKNAIFNRYIH